jgi:uncharacterized YigZ family protein
MERGGDAEAYRTVARRGRAVIEIRGSEFIGHVAPIDSVEDAEGFVADVRAAHPDATHNVPAYRVRDATGLLREHSSDEGEPSGTAGTPTLTVLQRRDVEDVAVVVTRYFGGTELGVGGLARAYGETTKRALDDAGVIEQVPHRTLVIDVAYDDSGTVRGVLESEAVEFEADYGERVGFEVRVPIDEADHVADRLRSATSGRADVSLK